ncbi:MAG: VOC family protein [Sphingomonadales bacterium]|nr:VOC family protein [Sphingomonadales bacterium]
MALRGFFQNAYVTRNLDRAVALWSSTLGCGGFAAMDFELCLRTAQGDRPVQLRVATAWIGALQVELIEPVSGHVAPYLQGLPADRTDFVPRFHHVAVRREDAGALRREVAALGLPIVFETSGNGIASTLVDASARLGHPIEFVCADAAGWELLGWPTSRKIAKERFHDGHFD